MKRILLVILVLSITGLCYAADETEEITLTTYYPAPYGDYEKISANMVLLNPMAQPAAASITAADEGLLYYDTTSKDMRVYAGDPGNPTPQTYTWSSIGGRSMWQRNGTDLYYKRGNVGIGTDTPGNWKLNVNDGGDGDNSFTWGGDHSDTWEKSGILANGCWFNSQYIRIGNVQIAWGRCYLRGEDWKPGTNPDYFIYFPAPFKAGTWPVITATQVRPDETEYTTAFQIKEQTRNDYFSVWQSWGLEYEDAHEGVKNSTSLYLNWIAIGAWQ